MADSLVGIAADRQHSCTVFRLSDSIDLLVGRCRIGEDIAVGRSLPAVAGSPVVVHRRSILGSTSRGLETVSDGSAVDRRSRRSRTLVVSSETDLL